MVGSARPGWSRKTEHRVRVIYPAVTLLGIVDFAIDVGTVVIAAAQTDGIIVEIEARCDWQTAFEDRRTCNCPATERGVSQAG